MKQFEIKLTGSGTLKQIEHALRDLARSVAEQNNETVKRTFEDGTLCAEIITYE